MSEEITREDQDQHESWLASNMTEQLLAAIATKKSVWLKQLAMKSPDGSIDQIRVLGGRIQGLQDAEELIHGRML